MLEFLSCVWEAMRENVEAIGVIVAAMAVLLTLYTFSRNNVQRKRQATIDYFTAIDNRTYKLVDRALLRNRPFSYREMEQDQKLYGEIRRYLSFMERMSVGIRSSAYDAQVFDRMYGHTTLAVHRALIPYLEKITLEKGSRFYGDYTWLIGLLCEIREKRNRRHKDCTREYFFTVWPWHYFARIRRSYELPSEEHINELLSGEAKSTEKT